MLRLSTLGPRRAARPITRVQNPQLNLVTSSGIYPQTGYIDVSYSERIVLTSSFNSSDASVTIRVAFYDVSYNFLGYSEALLIEGYNELDLNNTSRYGATLYVIANELGASYIKINLIENVHNGNLIMYVSNS